MSEVKDTLKENEDLKKQVIELSESLAGYEADYDELCKELDELRAELKLFKASDDDEDAMDEEEAEEEYSDEEDDEQMKSEHDEEAEDSEEEAEEEEAEEKEEEAEEKEEEAEEEEEQAEDEEEKEARLLAKALRNLGTEPIATKPNKVAALNVDEVLEKFASISDPKERADFYATHRTIIFN